MRWLRTIAVIGLALGVTACAAQRQGNDGKLIDQTVEGFAELVSATNEREYETCRGEQRQSWFEYDDGKQAVEWLTASVPEAYQSGRILFTWSCGMTARQAFTVAHDLYLNGEKVITFAASVQDTVHQRDRLWSEGQYALYYDYVRTNDWGDSFGVMHLSVPASAVSPGEAATLKVVGSPTGAGSFFMLTDYTDTAAWLRTQHGGGPVPGLREVTHEQIASLKAKLQHAEEDTRLSAASDLIRLDEPEGTTALTELMLEGSVEARRAAAADLLQAREPSTTPALIEALDDEDVGVRLIALEALGDIGDPSTAPALIKALDDEDTGVKLIALEALGDIGDPSTTPSLTRIFQSTNGAVKAAALTALTKMGEFRLPLAMQALEDEDREIRLLSLHAMASMPGDESLPAMKAALQDECVWVRNAAAYALGENGDLSAVPALIEALSDSDEFVQKSAAAALCTVTGQTWMGTDGEKWQTWWEQNEKEQ